VYLVFASLILPALAVRSRPPGQGMLLAWGLGALAYAAGLAASALFDWPTGPAIVIALACCSLLFAALLRVAARRLQR
jgi:zinc/manganese transport system permease protein